MMKIYLDDERETPSGFDRTYSAMETIDVLKANWNQVEVLSLDHDLGIWNTTGYDVMLWIESQIFCGVYDSIPEIVFHTANPVGRNKMNSCLISIKKELEKNCE